MAIMCKFIGRKAETVVEQETPMQQESVQAIEIQAQDILAESPRVMVSQDTQSDMVELSLANVNASFIDKGSINNEQINQLIKLLSTMKNNQEEALEQKDDKMDEIEQQYDEILSDR